MTVSIGFSIRSSIGGKKLFMSDINSSCVLPYFFNKLSSISENSSIKSDTYGFKRSRLHTFPFEKYFVIASSSTPNLSCPKPPPNISDTAFFVASKNNSRAYRYSRALSVFKNARQSSFFIPYTPFLFKKSLFPLAGLSRLSSPSTYIVAPALYNCSAFSLRSGNIFDHL